MESIFAVVVVIAIIALGAIISVGNERQRKALEGIRKEIEGWTVEDLRMKRAQAACEIVVENPQEWLERTAAHVFGANPEMGRPEVWRSDGVSAITAPASGGRTLVFTPVPANRFVKAAKARSSSRLTGATVAILGKNPRRVPVSECSILSHGSFFDLEATQVWQKLTGEDLAVDRLWLFEVQS